MQNKKVVFVLGAGASHSYGYPLGYELVESIVTKFNPSDSLFNLAEVEIFKKTLQQSKLPSIDAFLEKAENFKEDIPYSKIGRYAIALDLIKREKLNNLFKFGINEDLYGYLWSNIYRHYSALWDGRIAFITFNYDLSLEQFFYTVLKKSLYGNALSTEQEKELKNNVMSIPIIHVYGTLGFLKWQNNVNHAREYEGKKEVFTRPGYVQAAADAIKIMRNEEEETDNLKEARKLLKEANYVCFLGFGYDEINLKRLKVKEILKPGQNIMGTAYGLGEGQKATIKAYLDHKIKIFGGEKEGNVSFLKRVFTYF